MFLDLDFDKAFAENRVGAYERLLLEAIAGRLNLFVRSDEQEQAWRWVEPILRTWERDNDISGGPRPIRPAPGALLQPARSLRATAAPGPKNSDGNPRRSEGNDDDDDNCREPEATVSRRERNSRRSTAWFRRFTSAATWSAARFEGLERRMQDGAVADLREADRRHGAATSKSAATR